MNQQDPHDGQCVYWQDAQGMRGRCTMYAGHGGQKHFDVTSGQSWSTELGDAVHEAYVNAQRAVAALEWKVGGETYDHSYGRSRMQEDAVRAIRSAAVEARNCSCHISAEGARIWDRKCLRYPNA